MKRVREIASRCTASITGFFQNDKEECGQEPKSSKSNVPINHDMDETERKQRKELDQNVDETKLETSTSNPKNLEVHVKRGIHGVEVSKFDATEFERELQREIFGTWSEKYEVMTALKIPFKDFPRYLTHLQNAYEGFDEETRENLTRILLTEEPWDQKLVEWKYNNEEHTGARYCMMIFDRSPDMKFINSMYGLYKMDFTLNPNEKVEDAHKWLWKLFSWNFSGSEIKEYSHGTRDVPILQNFFRLKALEGFYQEGLIANINYIDISGPNEEKSSMDEESK